jgi:MFS transporter, FLVCR family, disrupted in renal carcinoma protein 2
MRWWVLGVYAVIAGMQGLNWAIPGPISTSTQKLFGWTSDDTSLLVNWGPIAFIPLSLPFAWLIDANLRWAVIASAACVVVGSWIRVIATWQVKDPSEYSGSLLVWMNVAQFVSDCGGPVAMGAVSRLSQVWFSPEQRAIATAVGTESNMLGVALAFLWGPGLFPDTHPRVEAAQWLWLSLAIPATVVLVLTVLTFPERPAEAPSESARIQRIASMRGHGGINSDIKDGDGLSAALIAGDREEAGNAEGGAFAAPASSEHTGWWGRAVEAWEMMVELGNNFQFWVLALGYGATTGVYGAWVAVLAINLQSVNVSQSLAGWIGFVATVAGCAAGLVSGHLLERFRQGKLLLIALTVAAGVSFLVFAVITTLRHDALHALALHPAAHPSFFATDGAFVPLFVFAALGGFFCTASVPAFYEMASETAFPLDQGFISTMLANMNNVACVLFLAVPINQVGTRWENWAMAAVCFLTAAAFALLFKEVQKRRMVDDSVADKRGALVDPTNTPASSASLQ